MAGVWDHISAKFTGGVPIQTGTKEEPGDLKSLMVEWAGKPRWDFNIDSYTDRNKDSWTLPEALRGENPEMKERIDFLTLWADNFYYRVLLPIRTTQKLVSQSHRRIYRTTLAQPVEEQVQFFFLRECEYVC